MSLLATLAIAASGATLPACSWDRPGVNPFMGDVVAAVDRYKDIPEPVRARLKERMQKRDYDEMVSITRDAISGKARYSTEIRDMHYGADNVCTTVTRAKWTQKMEERGLVYCEDGQCILVPTVCRNVSRIQRIAPPPKVAAVDPPLEFEAPAAGMVAGPEAAAPNSFAQLARVPTLDTLPPAQPSVLSPLVPPTTSLQPTALPPVTNPLPPLITPAVPEPGTWAMWLAGLGFVSFVARRRARSA